MITLLIRSVAIFISTLFLYTLSFTHAIQLEIGDIVLRTGTTVDSLVIQKLANVQYSHIGVITQISPEVIVVHATTDDDPNKPNQVLATKFDTFVSPKFAKNFLIIRPNFLSTIEKNIFATEIANKTGHAYILKNQQEENLYCTTLLEQPLLKLRPTIQLKWHAINLGPFQGDYLFPDTFMDIEGMTVIQSKVVTP